MSETPAISVLVATRNRAASLGRLFEGLQAQRGAPPFEIIVADNGSTDDTAAVLRKGCSGLNLRSVRVARPGKGPALNAALRLAKGDLIVFTDDDVSPDERWLAELLDASLRFSHADVFGGGIEVDRAAVPDWIRRSHNLMSVLTAEHELAEETTTYGFGRYPFGPNMAVRRSLIAEFEAPYPEDMGPGTDIPVGDENGFLMRISPPEAKNRQFVPAARVRHRIEPRYLRFSSALRRVHAVGLAEGRLRITPLPLRTDDPGLRISRPARILARLRACRSLREVLCLAVRHAGYLWSSRTTRTRVPA